MRKNNIISAFATAIVLLYSGSLSAQSLSSGYFLDNYTYRYQLNPAFGNERGFASTPVLGNINADFRGNLNLTDVIYKSDGKTVLFTNPQISSAEVMDNISDKNIIGTNLKFDIVNVGFKALGGYNVVGVDVRANINALIPGSLFELAKEGVANKTYDITNLKASANAYAELTLNHSHQINSKWRIGGTLKFLLGAGNVDAYFNQAQLTLGQDSWTALTNADIYASVGGLSYKHKINSDTGHEYVSGAKIDGYSIQGFGMAVDLGAEYKVKDFSFSAAVLDFGFMNWGKTQYASTNGTQSVNTDAYIFNVSDDAANSFSDEWDIFKDDLSNLYQLNDEGELSSRTRMLAATVNAGVDYALPVYRRLHFGLLNTTRINGDFTWTKFRLSANVNPINALSVNANIGYGTYGFDFGWLVNFSISGFNIFLGMETASFKLAKQGVPLNSNVSANFGITYPF
jgi:hypothetical protein